MLLAYLDESFAKDANYWIAAMVIKPKNVGPLTTALDRVVAQAHNAFDVPSTAELHGHPLVQGKDDWAVMSEEVRARIAVYRSALEVIAQHAEKIFVRGVNRPAFRKRYEGRGFHEHGAAMTFIYENIDNYARRRDERALCIADECSHEDGARADLKWFQRWETWGYKRQPITQIIDTCLFVPSHASRMVQAADLIAYIHRRHRDHQGGARSAAATAALYSQISPLVTAQLWTP